MASDIVAARRGESSLRRRPSSNTSAGRPTNGHSWLPIALGTAAVVVSLGSRRKRTALALTALAGVAAVEAMRRDRRDSDKTMQSASGAEPEVQRSITVGRTPDELRRAWLDLRTLPQIIGDFATVRPLGDGRMHWKVEGPLGRAYEWDSETVDERANGDLGWRSLPNASISNEGSVHFRPAPAGRGTVATLRLRFARPNGAFGDAAFKLLGTKPLAVAADGALRRFKSLVETGEIPTTERQPAARADTR